MAEEDGEDGKAGFGPVLSATVVLLSAFGAAANAACVLYVTLTFPWKKAAVFALALYDAAFSMAGNLFYAKAFALAVNVSDNFGLCSLMLTLGALQIHSGFLLTAAIAAVRFASLVLGKRKKRLLPEGTCAAVCFALHLAMSAFILTFNAIQVAEGAVVSKSVAVCMRLDVDAVAAASTDKSGKEAPVRVVIILLTTVAQCVISLACDVCIVYDIYKRNSSSSVHPSLVSKKKKKKKWSAEYTVPVNATLSSMALLLTGPAAVIVGYGLFGIRLDEATKIAVMMLYVPGCNALRCPLQTALTFGAKVRADQESKAKRQERERQWAREAMELRRRIRADEDAN